MDLGVDDVEAEEGKILIYCDKDKTFEIKNKLEQMGYTVEVAELVMKPMAQVVVEDAEMRVRIETILEKLTDLDDVQKVWTNYA